MIIEGKKIIKLCECNLLVTKCNTRQTAHRTQFGICATIILPSSAYDHMHIRVTCKQKMLEQLVRVFKTSDLIDFQSF